MGLILNTRIRGYSCSFKNILLNIIVLRLNKLLILTLHRARATKWLSTAPFSIAAAERSTHKANRESRASAVPALSGVPVRRGHDPPEAAASQVWCAVLLI